MCDADISICFRLVFFFFCHLELLDVNMLVTINQVALLLVRMLRNRRTLSVQAEHQKASCLAELPKSRRVTSQNLLATDTNLLGVIMMIIFG